MATQPHTKGVNILNSHWNKEDQSTLRRISNISASIREDTSYAQAAARPRPTGNFPTRKEPTPAPIEQNIVESAIPQDRPQYWDKHQASGPPAWVADLKSELAAIVTTQFKTLAAQVAENTQKIDYILSTMHK